MKNRDSNLLKLLRETMLMLNINLLLLTTKDAKKAQGTQSWDRILLPLRTLRRFFASLAVSGFRF